MRYILLEDNWPTRLANIVTEATDGDTVVVSTPTRAELGRRSCRRLGKSLIFEIVQAGEDLATRGDGVVLDIN